MINNRKRVFILPRAFLLCFIISISVQMVNIFTHNNGVAYATTTEDIEKAEDTSESVVKRVYDEAELMTDDEIADLEALSKKYGENAGIEIFILTHNDPDATYPERYIEDFEDQLPIGDRVYFLYDVYGGEIFMEGYGLAETYIHSKRIDNIFDNVEDDLIDKNYYDAFETYIIMSADYMADDSELNYDHDYSYDTPPEGFDSNNEFSYDEYDYDQYYKDDYDHTYYDGEDSYSSKGDSSHQDDILKNIWFQLFISLIIGGVVVGIMAYNSSGRMTAGSNDYLDRSKPGLIGRRDHYIRSTVTKVRKPTQNTSSGGGGRSRGGFNSGGFRGGRSSGGRSHSSGGRKL